MWSYLLCQRKLKGSAGSGQGHTSAKKIFKLTTCCYHEQELVYNATHFFGKTQMPQVATNPSDASRERTTSGSIEIATTNKSACKQTLTSGRFDATGFTRRAQKQ